MSILERINKSIGVLLIVAITITLSVFLYDFYSIVTNSTQREAENHIVQSTMTSASMIHEKLKSDLNTVYTLSSELSGYENINSPKAKVFLKKVGNELPFSIIVVSSIDGTYYTNSGSEINLKEPKYLTGATGTKKTISVIYQNALFGKDMIALESSIYQNNKVVGKVSGLYYTNSINNILDYTANGNEHQYQIIERSGMFLLPSGISIFRNYDDIYSFFNNVKFSQGYETSDFINDFFRGKAGVATFEYGGDINNLCYVPIEINNWYLVTVVPANTINLQAFTMQNPTVLLSIRIIILFVVLILYIIWRQMRYRLAMEKSRNDLEVLNEKLQIRNETLKLKAENDLLTGLYNKMTSERMINDFIENEGRNGRHALLVIDIDDFKGINDELGHFFGDKALTEVANGIDHYLRTTDIKGRIGGDEFIILLKNIQSDDTVIQKAKEICRLFKDIKIEEIPMLKISGSIGVSIYPDHAANYADLFIKADKAMYYSKELGKDRYSIYSSDLEN
ncbi:MAG: diguanylate cyclase [Bacillota bacterium]